MEKLDETHAALGQPPGQQTIGGEGARLARVGTVQRRRRASAPSTGPSTPARSSASGRPFVLRDARADLRVAGLFHAASGSAAPRSSRNRRRVAASTPGGLDKEQHRVAGRAKLDALVSATAESRCPRGGRRAADRRGCRCPATPARRTPAVAVLAAQAVGQPGAHARPARQLGAGLEEGDGRVVVDRLGVHRLDEAQIVGHAGGVRQQFADPGAALAVPGEAKLARGDRESVPGVAVMPVSRWPLRIESGRSWPRRSRSRGL